MPRRAEPQPTAEPKPVPPIGVKVSTDMERRSYGIRARARWTDPTTKRRVIRSEIVRDEAAAHAFFDQLRNSSTKGMDVSMTLLEFVTSIGDRWARGLDPTSTGETYGYGLKLRVLPALGHLPVTQITAGIIDRTIDEWEQRHGASTIKNTIAPLVRVLDEAVRDGLIQINPAKNRAKRSLNRNAFRGQSAEHTSPRAHAIPDMKTLNRLARACGKVHQSYSDFVMLAALLAARSSEVSGLQAGDVDYGKNLVVIRRQVFPGKGGLVTKPTKSRKERRVPILEPLRPVLERLTDGKEPEDSLLVGPKGGYLTTATVRPSPHHRRNGFGQWIFHPAAEGQIPRKGSTPRHPVPLKRAGWTGIPISGTRNAAERSEMSWLPIAPGLTPHGLRHSHKTLMEEARIHRALQDERLGHTDGTVQSVYTHVTPTMREELITLLERHWEESLKARARMWPSSQLPILDRLIGRYRHLYRTYIPVQLPEKLAGPHLVPSKMTEAHHPSQVIGL